MIRKKMPAKYLKEQIWEAEIPLSQENSQKISSKMFH